jgi:ATP-dependent DNA ligase
LLAAGFAPAPARVVRADGACGRTSGRSDARHVARELPLGDYLYEPKWDGFRCLAFRDGTSVDLRSRRQRPLARYFPEIVEALLALDVPTFAIDGELVVVAPSGGDFDALLGRLHRRRPASSCFVERRRREAR